MNTIIGNTKKAQTAAVDILHLEDNPADVLLLKNKIISENCLQARIQPAGGLAEGIDILTRSRFDAILLDLSLPDCQGPDTYHNLQRHFPTLAPVVIVSDALERPVINDLIRSGVQDFICKETLKSVIISDSIEKAVCRGFHHLEANTLGLQTSMNLSQIHAIVDISMDGLLIVNGKGIILFANPAAEKMFKRSKTDLLGSQFGFAIASDKPVEIAIRRLDGTSGVAELRTSALLWNGELCHLAAMHDVTERIRSHTKIRRLNRMHKVSSGINNLIVRVSSKEELFTEATKIAVIDGELPAAWIGLTSPNDERVEIVSTYGADSVFFLAASRMADDPFKTSSQPNLIASLLTEQRPIISNDITRDRRIDQKSQYTRFGIHAAALIPLKVHSNLHGVLALYSTERGFFNQKEIKLLMELAGDIAFAMDYLEKVRALDHMANYDPVTGLPNRFLLRDRLIQALQFSDRYQMNTAVLYIDLDRFKLVNDNLGHACGDEVLRIAGQRISNCLRVTDTVARQGGDEFIVVLAGNQSDEQSISSTTQRIVNAFAKPMAVEGQEVCVTCSIGVAVYAGGGTDPDLLLRHADTAMYRVKEQGGNNFRRYRLGYDKVSQDRLAIETDLRNAMERNEFQLFYQPKADFYTRKVTGAEALLRWHQPERGCMEPGSFISIAEETGMITQIGEWVLRTACEQGQRWQDVSIAVNLSARQFKQTHLAQMVANVLNETGFAPERLELELTESMLMKNVEVAILIMKELKNLGVKIALDDFGTGYSSLSYLKRFPIDTLKIDKSFIREINSDPNSTAIVDAIIAMARSLKLTVVAEGVENIDQFTTLQERGCDLLQGFLLSPPIDASQFNRNIKTSWETGNSPEYNPEATGPVTLDLRRAHSEH